MRSWRVGTISMGLLLIIVGVILLAALIGSVQLTEALLNWWPLLLVIIGVEILAYILLSKEEHPKVKYDIFSMFMIVVICIASFGAYTVSMIGILPRVKAMIASYDHPIIIEEKDISVPTEVNKIVLELSNATFDIKGHSESGIKIFGNGNVMTDSQENIDALLAVENIVSRRIDNTLILQFNELPRRTEFNQGIRNLKYTIVLPAEMQVEVKRPDGGWYDMNIDGSALKRNMYVDYRGPITISAGADANLMVEVNMQERHQLGGNVEWTIDDKDEENRRATLKIGEGKYKLLLFNRGEVNFQYLK